MISVFINDAASHHGQRRLDVFDLIRRNGKVIAIEHDQIGELAWLNRAEVVFLKNQKRVAARVRNKSVFAADGFTVHLHAARHFTGDGEHQGGERHGEIGGSAVAAKPPDDAAVL